MQTLDEITDAFVRETKVDYVGLWQIVARVRNDLNIDDSVQVRQVSLEIVRRLYEQGLRPGEYWGGPFDAWPDEGCQASLDRIEREWIALGKDPNLPWPICWFDRQEGC